MTRTLLAVTIAALASRVAVADPELPEQCIQFAAVPADARDDVFAWNQALSLAGCVQDGAVPRVTHDDQLVPLVEALRDQLTPPMTIYWMAVQLGPDDVEVRASYHIGMLYLGIATRARSSISVVPGPNAIPRNLALHAKLEPLIAPAIRTARQIFAAIDEAALIEPALEQDPVTGAMIRSARAMLDSLREPSELKQLTRESTIRALR